MSKNDPYVVGLIPARSGSKGIEHKNLLQLEGLPLIAWSIQASLKSITIDRTIVSTDSKEYANIAESLGAEVPFLRPQEISNDASTDYEFVAHALSFFETEGRIPDYIVHLRVTTPIRRPDVIDEAVNAMINSKKFTSLRSIQQDSESAYKHFEMSSEGNLLTIFEKKPELDNSNNARQNFPSTFSANGYVDVLISDYIRTNRKIHGNKVMAFQTEPVQEVDTIDDFHLLQSQVSNNPKIVANLFGGTDV